MIDIARSALCAHLSAFSLSETLLLIDLLCLHKFLLMAEHLAIAEFDVARYDFQRLLSSDCALVLQCHQLANNICSNRQHFQCSHAVGMSVNQLREFLVSDFMLSLGFKNHRFPLPFG